MKLGTCCVWMLVGVCLLAQEAEEKDKKVPHLAETLTVTAEKQLVSVEDTAGSVAVVDEAEIAQRGVHQIQDVLRFDPSVQLDYDATRFGADGFRIRGMGGNRVLTQVDGAPIVDGFAFGPLTTPRFHIDPSILKSVEVVKGAGSALYGSDAVAGVVSFVTKDPLDLLGSQARFAGDFRTQYDNRDRGSSATANMAFGFGKQALLISAGWRDFHNQETQGSHQSSDGQRTAANPLAGRNVNLLIKGTQRFSERSTLKLSYERFENQADVEVFSGQGRSVIFGVPTAITNYVAEDRQTRDRVSLDQEWLQQDSIMADRIVLSLFAQRSQTAQLTSEQRESAQFALIRQGTMDFEQEDLGIELELYKSWHTALAEMQLTYGVDQEWHHFEQQRGRFETDLAGEALPNSGYPTRYFPPTQVQESGLYGQLTISMFDQRLRVVPGVRYDRFDLKPKTDDSIFSEISESVAGLEDDAVSPKLGTRFNLGAGFALAGQWARGFRAPPYSSVNSGFTNLQAGYQTLANPDLLPETSTQTEASLRFKHARFSSRITYFENRYRDFIQDTVFIGMSSQGISLFQAQNLDRVDIEGWELQAAWQVHADWRLSAAWSDLVGRNLETQAELIDLEPSGGNVDLQFDHRRFDLRLAVFHRQAKRMPVEQIEPAAYTVADVWIGYELRRDWRLLLAVHNLGDETYYPWSYVRGRPADDPVIERYSAPGRNASLSLQLKF